MTRLTRPSRIDLVEKPSGDPGVTRRPQLLEYIKSSQRFGVCLSKHILLIPQRGLLERCVSEKECVVGRERLGVLEMSLRVAESALLGKQDREVVGI